MSQTYDRGSQQRMSDLFVHLISAGHLIQTTHGPGDSGVAHCMSWQCGEGGSPRVMFRISESDGRWYISTHGFQKFLVPPDAAVESVCQQLLDAENDDPQKLPEAVCARLGLWELTYEEYVEAFARWMVPDDMVLLQKATLRFIQSFGRLPASAADMRETRRWPRSVVFPEHWRVTFSGTVQDWQIVLQGAVRGVAWRVDQRGEVVACAD